MQCQSLSRSLPGQPLSIGKSPPVAYSFGSRNRKSIDEFHSYIPNAIGQAEISKGSASASHGLQNGSQTVNKSQPIRQKGLLSMQIGNQIVNKPKEIDEQKRPCGHAARLLTELKDYVRAPGLDNQDVLEIVQYVDDVYKHRKWPQQQLKKWFDVTKTVCEIFPRHSTIIGATFLCAVTLVEGGIEIQDLPTTIKPQTTTLVNKVKQLSYLSEVQLQSVSTLGKKQLQQLATMIQTMAEPSAVLIKLVERYHYIRMHDSLSGQVDIRQIQEIARQTMDVYVPIAERLGAYWLKGQLQDECFRCLHPQEYNLLLKWLPRIPSWKMTEGYTGIISKYMKQSNINAKVVGRPKSLYSIYRKIVYIKQQEFTLENVMKLKDIFAMRIVTDSQAECYRAFEYINRNWGKITGVKDMIQRPKANGYQSIHLSVDLTSDSHMCAALRKVQSELSYAYGNKNTPNGILPNISSIEVQIRNEEMHCLAEFGEQAHWRYKEAGDSVLPILRFNLSKYNFKKVADGLYYTVDEKHVERLEFQSNLWQRFVTEWVYELQDKICTPFANEAGEEGPDSSPVKVRSQPSDNCAFPNHSDECAFFKRLKEEAALQKSVKVLEENGIQVKPPQLQQQHIYFLYRDSSDVYIKRAPASCSLEDLQRLNIIADVPYVRGCAKINQIVPTVENTKICMGDVVEIVSPPGVQQDMKCAGDVTWGRLMPVEEQVLA